MTELSTVQKIMYKELGHHGKSGKASQDEDTVTVVGIFVNK